MRRRPHFRQGASEWGWLTGIPRPTAIDVCSSTSPVRDAHTYSGFYLPRSYRSSSLEKVADCKVSSRQVFCSLVSCCSFLPWGSVLGRRCLPFILTRKLKIGAEEVRAVPFCANWIRTGNELGTNRVRAGFSRYDLRCT